MLAYFCRCYENEPHTHCAANTANFSDIRKNKRIGYKNKLVAHGLRSLASTTLNKQGFDGDVIEAALAHLDYFKLSLY